MLADERRTSAFQREIAAYLERHPRTQHVDILLTDLNGSFRGKRIPLAGLSDIESGCYFPASVFAINLYGNTVEEAGLGQEKGEPDHVCVPVAGTLVPSAADPDATAQLLLTMLDEDGTPFDVEPRNVLNRIWQALRARGLFPVAAVELEFYLVDRARDASGLPQPPCAPGTGDRHTRCQVYSLDNLDLFAGVLNDIERLAAVQGLPAAGAVAESSPGQFEINLQHGDNLPAVCDQALQLKRLVRLVAEHHGMNATFMAKPYEAFAGSGMHIHISLRDGLGHNVLSDGRGRHSALMCDALAGMLDLMPASMALLAPNVNAFRRFQPGMYVPVQANWGYNNRTVALRIPCGGGDNHRVEYRAPGADANPYLVMAAVLAGVLHGLDNAPPLPEAVTGNGGDEGQGESLPLRQCEALRVFKDDRRLPRLLGERFCQVYHACKYAELSHFERLVTETEIDCMLKNA
ncbi:glutamine synthetase family protein [Acerihabitans arboris]|uniref:Glutamine synthetase n=1 Tax=Acerihabitans arboris TaxID=2691583 RepID=A0A845SI54_9GAMM|nr:glutamine synthetase family protein [Acerihabitans arboris]NDL62291.1 glutamine synthetase [Acerihabitans arboris]